MLPAGTDELFDEPVAGRHADLLWQSTNHDRPVEGGMIWRQDICDHIVLVEGSCPEPPSTDDTAVAAAVSEADAEMYEVSVGDVLPEVNSAYNAVDFEVTGIYRLQDPTRALLVRHLPTGRSGLQRPQPRHPDGRPVRGLPVGRGVRHRAHRGGACSTKRR